MPDAKKVKMAMQYCQEGERMMSQGEPGQAIRSYGIAIHHTGEEMAKPFVLRSKANLASRKISSAMADAHKAIELDPSDPEAWRARANAYVDKQEWEAAKSDFLEILKLSPGDERAQECVECCDGEMASSSDDEDGNAGMESEGYLKIKDQGSVPEDLPPRPAGRREAPAPLSPPPVRRQPPQPPQELDHNSGDDELPESPPPRSASKAAAPLPPRRATGTTIQHQRRDAPDVPHTAPGRERYIDEPPVAGPRTSMDTGSQLPPGKAVLSLPDGMDQMDFDDQQEEMAFDWVEKVSKVDRGEHDSIGDYLQNGVALCRTMVELSPNSIDSATITENPAAFQMMDNIAKFLEAAEAYGVRRADLFQTVDLYEAKNLLKVIDAIHAVGRAAKAAGYQGAAIGDTEAVDVPTQEAPRVMVVSNVSGYTLASDDGPPEMPPKLKRDGYSLADATEHSEPTDSAGPPPPRPKRVDSIIKSPTLSASETPKVTDDSSIAREASKREKGYKEDYNPYFDDEASIGQGKLAHEVDAGQPCLRAGCDCPGFELHVWKKKCKYCGCARRDHRRASVKKKGEDVQPLQFVEEEDPDFDTRGYCYDDDPPTPGGPAPGRRMSAAVGPTSETLSGESSSEDEGPAPTQQQPAPSPATTPTPVAVTTRKPAGRASVKGKMGTEKLGNFMQRVFKVELPGKSPKDHFIIYKKSTSGTSGLGRIEVYDKKDTMGKGMPLATVRVKNLLSVELLPTKSKALALNLKDNQRGLYVLAAPDSKSQPDVISWMSAIQTEWSEMPSSDDAVSSTPARPTAGNARQLMRLKSTTDGSAAAAAASAVKSAEPPQENVAYPPVPGPSPQRATPVRSVSVPSQWADDNEIVPAMPPKVSRRTPTPSVSRQVSAPVSRTAAALPVVPKGLTSRRKARDLVAKTHGDIVWDEITREDAERVLENHRKVIGKGASGLYLIRSSSKSPDAIAISMYAGGKMYHFAFDRAKDSKGASQYRDNKGKMIGESILKVIAFYEMNKEGLPCKLERIVLPK